LISLRSISSLVKPSLRAGCLPLLFGAFFLAGPLPAQDASPGTSPAAPVDSAVPGTGSATEQETAVAVRGDTKLHRNDLIRITVFQEDDLTTETRISKSGSIIFPLIGEVQMDGRTVDDVTAEIRQRLDKDYLVNPHVTLVILDFARQWVTVLGEVNKPGQVEIPAEGGLDLLGAIALAGGYTRIADPSHVIIRRVVDGKDVILKVNAKQLQRDIEVKPFIVNPGDTINVAQSLF
jgi:polysaccharide export outer membrane protein